MSGEKTEHSHEELQKRIKLLEERVRALEEMGGACVFDECEIHEVNIYRYPVDDDMDTDWDEEDDFEGGRDIPF